MSNPSPSPVVRSVLILDDHEPDVVWAKRVLRRVGGCGSVRSVATAREALVMLDDPEAPRDWPDFPPVVWFVDINMPGMDGFELLDALTARQRELRSRGAMPEAIVILTSSDDQRDVERSRAFDLVDDYLVKPLTERGALRVLQRYGSRAA